MSEKKSSRTDMLQGRSERCICKYCGGKLEVKSIVFNDIIDARTELYCSHCERIEFGVEKEIYQNAKYFVEEMDYNCFPDMDNTETTRQMSIAKVCDIMNWAVKNLGFMNDNGFCVPVTMNQCMLGKSILLTDKDLADMAREA